jgi:hypothetical protein
MPPTTASKKSISNEQWEAKLASVKVAKEDMNKLVMNFLVTEVNQCNSSCTSTSGSSSSSSWQKGCRKGHTVVLQHRQLSVCGHAVSCLSMSRCHRSEHSALHSSAVAVHACNASLQTAAHLRHAATSVYH